MFNFLYFMFLALVCGVSVGCIQNGDLKACMIIILCITGIAFPRLEDLIIRYSGK